MSALGFGLFCEVHFNMMNNFVIMEKKMKENKWTFEQTMKWFLEKERKPIQ
jgi:hypothetical protein